jgi:hypothetical protein
MVRMIGAVVAGILVVVVVVSALQYAGTLFYPPPEGLDPFDPASADAFTAYLEGMPPASWALAWASEILGAFLGALAAGWIAFRHRSVFAGVIVALAIAGSVNNWLSFSHPTWFIVGQLIAYPLVFLGVLRLLSRLDHQEA